MMDLKIRLLLGCLFTVAVLTCHLSCQEHDDTQVQESLSRTTERAAPTASIGMGSRLRAAFFKLLDFKSFKAIYNKHYGSLTEEIARHKLFLARYLKAKLSMVAYQMGLSTSHSGINRMSDWTQAERDRLKNKLDTKNLPSGHREKRSVETRKETVTVGTMSEAEAQRIGAIKDASELDRGVASMTKALMKMANTGRSKGERGPRVEDHQIMSNGRKGSVRVDLRKTNCFNRPRHQGLCGSCYVFAAIAQYEFMYCLAYGKKVKFSEQFVIDCGPEHLQMGGCEGGKPEQVAQFTHVLGLQKHSSYPYTANQGECRLSVGPAEHHSDVYAKSKSPDMLVAANLDEFEYWLNRKVPLYVSFGMHDSSYYDYAGGIDNPTDCDSEGHAMLVVGVGSDNKNGDYFILRNSLGTDWGRSGYYYVYKQAPCWRFGGSGWAPEGLRYKGKNAFSGVRGKQREVDDGEDEEDSGQEAGVQPRVEYVPNSRPTLKTDAYKDVNYGQYNFDCDDDEDADNNRKDKDDDDHQVVSQERTWTPAPPPKFEWKSNDHAPKYNPYEGLESKYEYDFDNNNDLHFGGDHSGYRDHNELYNQQQPQQVNHNGNDIYDNPYDRYDFG